MRTEVIGDATPIKGTTIYLLRGRIGGPVRYVGKTARYMCDRHKQHLREAKKGRSLPVCRWLAKQPASVIEAVEFVPDGQDWAARERYWIQHYRNVGAPLLNLTDGGEGLSGHSPTPEHRAKIAAKLRTGAHFACEVCDQQFWRKKRDIQAGHNRFCSRRCANTRHKGKGLFQ
jgi:hypothetical protein